MKLASGTGKPAWCSNLQVTASLSIAARAASIDGVLALRCRRRHSTFWPSLDRRTKLVLLVPAKVTGCEPSGFLTTVHLAEAPLALTNSSASRRIWGRYRSN